MFFRFVVLTSSPSSLYRRYTRFGLICQPSRCSRAHKRMYPRTRSEANSRNRLRSASCCCVLMRQSASEVKA